MCGSGTLLIEGAMMAADEAPGLLRWRGAQPSRWLRFDTRPGPRCTMKHASGRNSAARNCSRFFRRRQRSQGAARGDGQCRPGRARRTDPLRSQADRAVGGACVRARARRCNPPYNQRLAADAGLYREIGDSLRQAVPAWRASLALRHRGSWPRHRACGASKKYTMFNGTVECTLVLCDPVQPPQREARPPAPLSEGRAMVANRLRKNLKRFKSWRTRGGIDCYRVYDADLPEYSAAVDVYQECDGDRRVFLNVQEYAAPESIPEADTKRRFGEAAGRAARRVSGAARTGGGEDPAARQGRQQVRAPGSERRLLHRRRRVLSACA
jgi:23S rRNA (guanine2445-N2)-methyltransferase / 23S rRNA (guanine2069-N7)-methyltransferase